MLDFLSSLETKLMYFLNVNISNPVFDWSMPLFDDSRAWLIPMIALWLAVMIFGNRRSRLIGFGALILILLTDQISSGIFKPLIERIRPCNLLPGIHMWKDNAWIVIPDPVTGIYKNSWSFVSSHATNTAAQAIWWGWAFPRMRLACYCVAGTIGFSRIYIGVHWTSDVLGGWMLAGLCFGVLWWVSIRYIPILRANTETGEKKSEIAAEDDVTSDNSK